MKRIEAFIRPAKLADVRAVLAELGLHRFTLSGVDGFGSEHIRTQFYRGVTYTVDCLPMAKLEVVVGDDQALPLAHAIMDTAQTEGGDERVMIVPAEEIVRARNNGRGTSAIG